MITTGEENPTTTLEISNYNSRNSNYNRINSLEVHHNVKMYRNNTKNPKTALQSYIQKNSHATMTLMNSECNKLSGGDSAKGFFQIYTLAYFAK